LKLGQSCVKGNSVIFVMSFFHKSFLFCEYKGTIKRKEKWCSALTRSLQGIIICEKELLGSTNKP
jgi:hypothetical protein